MREKLLTKSEYDFVCDALSQNLRVGKRGLFDIRDIHIEQNKYNESCIVSLGDTRIISQVSAEIVKPKDTRPNEGNIKINLEIPSMLLPYIDQSKHNEYIIEVNRLLERNIIQSHVLDLESLCLRAGEKVWLLRVNLNTLNNDGNILDCANIAVLCALYSFRLPETSITDQEITIFSHKERNPSPLSIIHVPLIVTFGFFNKGNIIIIDPDELEEQCMDGKIVIGMNKHLEICMMELNGSVTILKDEVMRCVKNAQTKVRKISDLIEQQFKNNK